MIILGIAFSLVPSAMWPSVAKIFPVKQLGTAYALIFFIQNIGLWGVPALIGYILEEYCIVGTTTENGVTTNLYNYTPAHVRIHKHSSPFACHSFLFESSRQKVWLQA